VSWKSFAAWRPILTRSATLDKKGFSWFTAMAWRSWPVEMAEQFYRVTEMKQGQ
jgi:hypothetical protein